MIGERLAANAWYCSPSSPSSPWSMRSTKIYVDADSVDSRSKAAAMWRSGNVSSVEPQDNEAVKTGHRCSCWSLRDLSDDSEGPRMDNDHAFSHVVLIWSCLSLLLTPLNPIPCGSLMGYSSIIWRALKPLNIDFPISWHQITFVRAPFGRRGFGGKKSQKRCISSSHTQMPLWSRASTLDTGFKVTGKSWPSANYLKKWL